MFFIGEILPHGRMVIFGHARFLRWNRAIFQMQHYRHFKNPPGNGRSSKSGFNATAAHH
jgi:hypothetical protein